MTPSMVLVLTNREDARLDQDFRRRVKHRKHVINNRRGNPRPGVKLYGKKAEQ